MKKESIKFPATRVVHWPTGPVNTCAQHAQALRNLGAMLGAHVAVTEIQEEAECSNCKREAS